MKILCLRLSNLASLSGQQEIDFEQAPLAQAGLIAITGKTGAGKSTLLDAMCLALFDQIPRFMGAQGNLQDTSGQSLLLKDAKHILRRGCTKGFAEVDFLALNQKRYRARWEVKRAYNKLDGKLKVERAVTCLDDQQVLTQKISECTPCIEQLIGLSFEQFTRAVLLAQSEVGAFLKAKDQDRAALLEYLTNSHIFSLISQLSFEKTKAVKEELGKYQKFVEHLHIYTPEEIQQLENEKSEKNTVLEDLETTKREIEIALDWFKQDQYIQEKIEQQQKICASYEAQQPEMNEVKQQLRFLNQFHEIRPVWEAHINAKQQCQLIQENLKQQTTQLHTLEQHYQHAQQECEHHQYELKTHKEQAQQLQPIFQNGFKLDVKRQQLVEQFKEKRQEILELEQQKNALTTKIQEQQQRITQSKAQYQKTTTLLAQYQSIEALTQEPKANIEKCMQYLNASRAFEAFTQQYPHISKDNFLSTQESISQEISQCLSFQELGTQIESIEKEIQTHNTTLPQLEKTLEVIDQLNIVDQDLSNIHDDLSKHEQESNDIAEKLELQQKAVIDAQHKKESIQAVLNQQNLLQDKATETLRAQLQKDQPCMVCGSHQHPFIEDHTRLKDMLLTLQNTQIKEAQETLEESLQQLSILKDAQTSCKTTLHHLNEQKLKLENQKQIFGKKLQDILSIHFQMSQNADLDVLKAEIKEKQHTAQQKIQQLTEKLQQNKHQQKHIQSLNTQQQQFKTIEHDFNQLQSLETYFCHLFNPEMKEKWTQSSVQMIEKIQQDIQDYCAHALRLEQEKKHLENAQQNCLPLENEYQVLLEKIQYLEKEHEYIKKQGIEVKESILKLLSEHHAQAFDSVQAWYDNFTKVGAQKEQLYQQQQQILLEKQKTYEQVQHEYHRLTDNLQMWQNNQQEYEEKKQNWLNTHTEFNDTWIEFCLNSAVQHTDALQQKVKTFDLAFAEENSRLNTLLTDQKQHEDNKPNHTLVELTQQQIDTQQTYQEITTERDTISAKLLHHEENLKSQQKYQKEILTLQHEQERWNKIYNLIGHKEGEKFQKIAQQHHLDILIEYANQQLQPLAPRYQLQRIPNSLSLAIIDHDMNSEVRPVLSLSGGETFLVSLALALALANMASGSMKLESLFIDEGFGTLDPNSLHIVMDALDRLQDQGRKVVLISHVQEMHERIPVQIQVKAVGSGASQVNIIA